MMVMFLRAILIVRGVVRQISIVVMVARILGVVHCRENPARVIANRWRLEAEKDPKQQHPIENSSQHARDKYKRMWRRQAYLKGIFHSPVWMSPNSNPQRGPCIPL